MTNFSRHFLHNNTNKYLLLLRRRRRQRRRQKRRSRQMSSSAYFLEKKTTKKTTEEEFEEEEHNDGKNRFYDSRTRRTRETSSSLNSSSSENGADFPRVREILWDAETTTEEKETTTTVVWSSDVGPTIFQFVDDDFDSLAGKILEKLKSKSVSHHHLYARCDFSSSEGNNNNNTMYSSNSNSNDSFGIVTISSSSGVKSNKTGERNKRGFSHCSSERRVPLDVSFRRGGGSQEGKKRCERMASRLAWGKSFTSVRESFYATCDAMPLTTMKSIVVDAEEKEEEEEEEEMDKDKDEDEPLTPLDMWPMRIGAVVERCDGVKTKRNSPPAWKVHLTVALEMPSCAFRFAPIRPLRVSREFSSSSRVISALFDDDHFLNGYNGRRTRESSLSSSSTTRTKMTTGFLTLDRARRLCFLKTNSSRVHNCETPLVGVWIHRLDDDARDSLAFLQSSEVWAACLRYASNSVLRKVSQNGSFLVCVVNGKRKDDDGDYDKKNASAAMPRLECYDCVATQGKEPFVPHQVDVTLNTNADDSNDSADAFVLGAVKEINRASIAFNFDRNNNGIGKENRGKGENDEGDDDDDDDENHEIDDIIGYKNFGSATFPRPKSEDTKNMSEAEREVVALEKMLQNRHRRDEEFNNKSSPVRGTSVSTGNLSPRSLAADLVKRAERSFANNRRRVNKQTSMQKDARKDGHKPSSVFVDKVLRERLRLVRFVVEDQLEESFVEEEDRGRGRGVDAYSEEEEMATGIINTTIFRSNDHHQRENKSGPGDDGDYNDYHNDDSDDADAHILRKYTS